MCQYLIRLVLHNIIKAAVRNKEIAPISFFLSAYMADRNDKDSTKTMMKHYGRSKLSTQYEIKIIIIDSSRIDYYLGFILSVNNMDFIPSWSLKLCFIIELGQT